MQTIRQEGGVVTRIDVIEVAPEYQEKLLEGMSRRAKAAEPAEAAR